MVVEQLLRNHVISEQDSASQHLSSYFLSKKKEIDHISLNQVVADTNYSKSTIIRFVNALGCDNFTKFSYLYHKEIQERQRRGGILQRNFYIEDDVSFLFKELCLEDVQSSLRILAGKILTKKKIILIGELRETQIVESCLPTFFDLDVSVQIINTMCIDTNPEDAVYIILTSHYTIENFELYTSFQIIEFIKKHANLTIGLIAYPQKEINNVVILPVLRNWSSLIKKMYILWLFHYLITQIWYLNYLEELKK